MPLYNPATLVYDAFILGALLQCCLLAACFVLCESTVFLFGFAGTAAHFAVGGWSFDGPAWIGKWLLHSLVVTVPGLVLASVCWMGGSWSILAVALAVLGVVIHGHVFTPERVDAIVAYFQPIESTVHAQTADTKRASEIVRRLVACVVIVCGLMLIIGSYNGISTSFRHSVVEQDWRGVQMQIAEAKGKSRGNFYQLCVQTKQVIHESAENCSRPVNAPATLDHASNVTLDALFQKEHPALFELARKTKAELEEYEKRMQINPFGLVAFLELNPLLRSLVNYLTSDEQLMITNRLGVLFLLVFGGVSLLGYLCACLVAHIDPAARAPSAGVQFGWLVFAASLYAAAFLYTSPTDLSTCQFDARRQTLQDSCFLPTYVLTPQRSDSLLHYRMQTKYVEIFDEVRQQAVEEGRQQVFGDAWQVFLSFDRTGKDPAMLRWYDQVRSLASISLKQTTGKAADEALARLGESPQLMSNTTSFADKLSTWLPSLSFFLKR